MFKSSIELNKSNSWVLITTFYALINAPRKDRQYGRGPESFIRSVPHPQRI